MKIGIMSMQRVVNYGSFLQAYGLKSIINAIGYEARFIDFHMEDNGVVVRNQTLKDFLKKGIRFLLHRTNKRKRRLYKKAKVYENNFSTYFQVLGLDKEYDYNSDVDLLIIGSDEVFNCFQSQSNQVLSYDLFGKGCKARKIVSYAASFGSSKYERFVSAGIDNEIGYLLSRFARISVRDNNSFLSAELLTGRKDIEMNFDPVLMYEFKDEIAIPNVSEPYIVVYAYRGRISPKEGRAIRKFAKKKNMKLYCIGGVQDFCDDFIVASPFEVLGWMKGASYVITDTFHGTVFSIKYGIKFASIIRDNNREKLYDLLCKFNLKDREVYDIDSLEKVIEKEFDGEKANELIKKERIRTIQYLIECINNCYEGGD